MPTPFEAFQLFQAMKLHFTTTSYNAFRYEFKTNVRYEKFESRKDKHFFYRLVKKYTTKDSLRNFFLASIIKNPSGTWVGHCDHASYEQWKKRNEGLTYFFKEDCRGLIKRFEDPKYLFRGEPPALINEYLGGRISLETLTILDSFTGVSEKLEEDGFFNDTRELVFNYRPFLKFDPKKMAKEARLIFEVS